MKAGDQIHTDVMERIKSVYYSSGEKMNLDEAYFNVALSKNLVNEEQRGLYNALFRSDTKDYQSILTHMIDLDVIRIINSDNRIDMPAYEAVTNVLKSRGEYVDFKVLVYLITEEIARNQAQKVGEENTRMMAKGRTTNVTEWYLVMHSLTDQTRYAIPETLKQSMESYERTNEHGETKNIQHIV
jgi:hypothetical protein